MSEVKILPDGSLMNEENSLYMFMGKKVNGKPIIPDGVEDIKAFSYSGAEIYNEYEGGYYLGSEDNPYKYFCKKTRSATNVCLHPDTEYICYQAFYGFRGELKFNNKLKGIGEEAFKNAFEMCKATLVIPDGCLKIGVNAFKHNYTPPVVYLPGSITYIGKGAFPSYPAERIFALPKVLALISKDLFIAKALTYFNSGKQTTEDDAKWLAEMESCKNPFVKAAIFSKNVNALLFALSNKLTQKSDYDKIVEVATATQNTALKAAVLGTTAKPTIKEREKTAEKEVEKAIGIRALSVADIKKLWEYRVDDDGCATLTKYIGSETIPTIPEKIGKALVKRIGNKALRMCEKAESIYVPEGIVAIGDCAFADNKALATVELPNSLLVVGKDLFANCKSLKNIPDTSSKTLDLTDCEGKVQYDYCRFDAIKAEFKWVIDTAKNECAIEKYVGTSVDIVVPETLFGVPVTVIKRDAFSSGLTYSGNGTGAQQKHNKTIKSIKLPESIVKIDDYAFSGCVALESLNVPLNCEVGKCAFLGCKKLAKDKRLVIFNGTLYRCIDSSAIYTGISNSVTPYSVVVPAGVNAIADYAFERCMMLECVEFSSSVAKIGQGAFKGCSSLEKITLPASIVEIGNYAFQECAINEIEIPSSIISIGCGVFFGCTSLECVTIPETVTSIDEDAFRHCHSVVIRAKKGSCAEEFANANDIRFEVI